MLLRTFDVVWRWAGENPSCWPVPAANLISAVRSALRAPALEEGRKRLVGLDVRDGGRWFRFRPDGIARGVELYDGSVILRLPEWVMPAPGKVLSMEVASNG